MVMGSSHYEFDGEKHIAKYRIDDDEAKAIAAMSDEERDRFAKDLNDRIDYDLMRMYCKGWLEGAIEI